MLPKWHGMPDKQTSREEVRDGWVWIVTEKPGIKIEKRDRPYVPPTQPNLPFIAVDDDAKYYFYGVATD